ncbi:MAG: hypothetical protein HKO07_03415, partial [Pseudomonadales bacterium]|nr:hypothetical protein [Pseudomonadales bacterium]
MFLYRYVVLVTSTALLLHGGAVSAADPHDTILQCRAASSSELRIACLEQAILNNESVAGEFPVDDLSLMTETEPEVRPANGSVEPAPVVVHASAAEEAVPNSNKNSTAPVSVVPARAEPVTETSATNFGKEQIDARSGDQKKSSERFELKVIEFDFVGRDKLRV